MGTVSSHERQATPGPRHGYVEEASRRIIVLAAGYSIPPAVEHDDVVELDALRSVCELREKGVTIIEPDIAAFREASRPLYEKFLETESQRAMFEALTAEQ